MNVEPVVEFLVQEGGYRVVQDALNVEGIEFQFDGILVGPGEEGGLVIVVDAEGHSTEILIRRVSAFSRVLSRTDSRRPLALVVVGSGRLDRTSISELEGVVRLVEVGRQEALELSLRRLLPLRIPDRPIQPTGTADAELRARGIGRSIESLTEELINAAEAGEKGVRDLLRARVRDVAAHALSDVGLE